MTLRYVHPTEKDKREAVEKVTENLFPPRQKHVNAQNEAVDKGLENRAYLSDNN
jgi:hypothetical protein